MLFNATSDFYANANKSTELPCGYRKQLRLSVLEFVLSVLFVFILSLKFAIL